MDKLKLNIKFEEDLSFQHPDFTKVTVWIATYGENANGSNITREAFENALPSLYNVPILGEWSESIDDFKGHGGKLEISDEGIKFIQTTKAYGVIPESCNPRWENDDSGVEYLVCDGILWTGRYDEAKKVMDNTCNQSMEISVNNYENIDNSLVIDSFNFTGICILGEDTKPCFPSSRIVYSLNKDEYVKEFNLMLAEINKLELEKGGIKLEEERRQIIEKYSTLKGNEQFEAIVTNADLDNKELENQLFSLSVNDLESRIREELSKQTYVETDWWGDTYECRRYWLRDVLTEENIVIAEDNQDYYKDYGIPYTVSGDAITLDFENAKRYVRGDWRPFEEGSAEPEINPVFEEINKHNSEKAVTIKAEFETTKENFEKVQNELTDTKANFADLQSDKVTLEEEVNTLKEFKENFEKKQKEQEYESVVEEFSELSKVEGFEAIVNKKFEFSLENLKKEFKALAYDNGIVLGKKKTSSQKNFSNDTLIKTTVTATPEENLSEAEKRYGSFVKKYINN